MNDPVPDVAGRDVGEEQWVSPLRRPQVLAPDAANPKDRVGDTKPPLHLVPPSLLVYLAEVMKDGAEKYGPYNWREHPVKAHVYVAAALRHITAWYDGEDDASDSGLNHLAHAAAGLGILLDAMATGNLVDDRPVPGVAGKMIEGRS